MLIPVAASVAIQVAAAAVQAGVGAATEDGRICVAMPAPPVAGSTLTLIRPNGPQSPLFVVVDRGARQCEPLERAQVAGPYYLVEPPPAVPADAGRLWVAFPGRLGTRPIASGVIGIELSRVYPEVRIRSCSSHEGLHLTVWSGAPLSSERLWHRYYYLGYDLEPTCDSRDTEP